MDNYCVFVLGFEPMACIGVCITVCDAVMHMEKQRDADGRRTAKDVRVCECVQGWITCRVALLTSLTVQPPGPHSHPCPGGHRHFCVALGMRLNLSLHTIEQAHNRRNAMG